MTSIVWLVQEYQTLIYYRWKLQNDKNTVTSHLDNITMQVIWNSLSLATAKLYAGNTALGQEVRLHVVLQ